MTNKELLISRLILLSEEDIASLLDAANHMEGKNALTAKPDCPSCCSHTVICYGHKCRKQRFFCKSYGRTFVPTTHTILCDGLRNYHALLEITDCIVKDCNDPIAENICF